jgi:hypothetical protein
LENVRRKGRERKEKKRRGRHLKKVEAVRKVEKPAEGVNHRRREEASMEVRDRLAKKAQAAESRERQRVVGAGRSLLVRRSLVEKLRGHPCAADVGKSRQPQSLQKRACRRLRRRRLRHRSRKSVWRRVQRRPEGKNLKLKKLTAPP